MMLRIVAAVALAAVAAHASVPPCEMAPNCKKEENCAKWGGPNTENMQLFSTTCLNNVKWAEPAFFGQYDKFWEAGVYKCSCCGLDLYSSEHKYDSGSGWPAYYDTINEHAVLHNPKDGELVCGRCGAHLGHRFDDGPGAMTGIRDCINSVCLDFHANSSLSPSDPDLELLGSFTGNSFEHERPEDGGDIASGSLSGGSSSSSTTSSSSPRMPTHLFSAASFAVLMLAACALLLH
mmetsp:Transcript_15442/g.43205  ORF Transcript_15442/g.43205 Transcript_15442/m.43205 type:complete len:235 (-) Transcript_15442:278-982(-)|eukprot:CAMPEP_0117675896 /NCGR_PEP_ID=MMETSP0804-20121206/15861_1 /TAXON_ID=1074897 /ORGANISM="Tetraselmis astigmatica, Strain CCMP880" /LENGTH=234 /DNA_ID=CAMNT_0005484953 /DNA_START=819 /DNA_END=1523 /DNA_ORIENTATION=+